MKIRKKWWLGPIMFMLLLLSMLFVFTQGSTLAPFHLHAVLGSQAQYGGISMVLPVLFYLQTDVSKMAGTEVHAETKWFLSPGNQCVNQ
jgi:hypothetical protein